MAFLEEVHYGNRVNVSKFKVVLLGDSGVGKTTLFLRIKDDVFRENIPSNIGIDSCIKTIRVDNKDVQVNIWDTAGVERFRTLTRNFYRNAQAVLLVFSTNDPSTLYALDKWERDAKEFAPRALKFLIGNKTDLQSLVSQEIIESFASSRNCEYAFLTSAKTGQGVDEALRTVIERLVSFHSHDQYDVDNSWLEESIHVNLGDQIGGKQNGSKCSC